MFYSKFLHAREDYKQSWQLEKEWEISTKGKDVRGTVVASAGKTETEGKTSQNDKPREDIPFACVICKGPYKYPIVTGCGHYFCEPCALKRYKKDPTCAICGAGTGGVFNTARKLKQ
jgi:RING finger protein 113A